MLIPLALAKTRLGIAEADTQFDALLTNAIAGIGAQFDRECHRTLARGVDVIEEFSAEETEVRPARYPVESVLRFELKRDEGAGWEIVLGAEYIVRSGCVLTLRQSLGERGEQARVVYTGGYVLPGDVPGEGQTPLPDELIHAALEQVATWFQNRDKLGLLRSWPTNGTFQQFMDTPLLPVVRAILKLHERWLV